MSRDFEPKFVLSTVFAMLTLNRGGSAIEVPHAKGHYALPLGVDPRAQALGRLWPEARVTETNKAGSTGGLMFYRSHALAEVR